MKKGLAGIVLGMAFSVGCGENVEPSFMECLVDDGVHGYNAWWCDACQLQEKNLEEELGEYWQPFKEQVLIECFEPGEIIIRKDLCREKNITFYPFWEFHQGTEWKYGSLSLPKLSEYSGCAY